MTFLILSILSTTLLYLLFKWFAIKGVQVFEAIMVNYLVAFTFGISMATDLKVGLDEALQFPTWCWGALLLGISFISIFNVTGKSAQLVGVSNTTIAGKMSLVLVVIIFTLTNPEEQLTSVQWIAIGLAIMGIVLSSIKADGRRFERSMLVYPAIIFFGSTLIDYMIPKLSETAQTASALSLYACLPFLTAGISGLLYVLYNKWRKTGKTFQFGKKEWQYGALLGVVNYGSIFFLVKTIDSGWMLKTSIICLNNLGVVMLSTMIAVMIFKERLSKINWAGLALSVMALLLLMGR
jgi:drug/metabolite transporter (DMT)-like permease